MSKTTGLVLGRFLPPHLGHQYLIDFAQSYVDELYLIVGTRPTDEIDGMLRVAWLEEMAPRAHVLRVDDENPEETHPQYWQIWEQTLRAALPVIPGYIFASCWAWSISRSIIPVPWFRSPLPG